MTLSAARQVWVMLKRAEHAGVHSLTIRQTGTSGNPSERLREIAAQGVDVRKRRENIGRRPGIRAWLGEYAPNDAVRIEPNGSGPAAGEATPPSSGSRAWVRNYDGTWDLDVPVEQVWTA